MALHATLLVADPEEIERAKYFRLNFLCYASDTFECKFEALSTEITNLAETTTSACHLAVDSDFLGGGGSSRTKDTPNVIKVGPLDGHGT